MHTVINRGSWPLRATLLLVSTLTVMASATISPALPGIQARFSDVPNASFWVRLVLTLPALVIALCAPLAGLIVDRSGRKVLLAASTALYGVSGAAGFLIDELWLLLASRAVLGLAVAGVITSVTTLITDFFWGDEQASMLGWQAAFMGFGGVAFLTAGGALADLGWRMPFLIYLLGLLLLPPVVFVLREPARSQGVPKDEPEQPLPRAFLSAVYMTLLLSQVMFYTIPVQLSFHLASLLGASATLVGVAVATSTFSLALTSMFYQRLHRHFDHRAILMSGFLTMGLGFVVLGLAQSYPIVFGGLSVAGVGLGLIVPNLNAWVAERVPGVAKGRALGGMATALFLGQFLSPVVAQPLAAAFGSSAVYLLIGVLGGVIGLVIGFTRRPIEVAPS